MANMFYFVKPQINFRKNNFRKLAQFIYIYIYKETSNVVI